MTSNALASCRGTPYLELFLRENISRIVRSTRHKLHELLDLRESPIAIAKAGLEPAHLLDRIIEEGEEGPLFFFAKLVAQNFVDEHAKTTGGVVDDMAELAVVAVNITDDVDAAFGESELGLKEGDLRHYRRGRGELPGQKAQGGAAAPVHGEQSA